MGPYPVLTYFARFFVLTQLSHRAPQPTTKIAISAQLPQPDPPQCRHSSAPSLSLKPTQIAIRTRKTCSAVCLFHVDPAGARRLAAICAAKISSGAQTGNGTRTAPMLPSPRLLQPIDLSSRGVATVETPPPTSWGLGERPRRARACRSFDRARTGVIDISRHTDGPPSPISHRHPDGPPCIAFPSRHPDASSQLRSRTLR